MIKTPTDLQLVREQVQRLENTLANLRSRVEPQNPRRFRLMAESYVESLTDLREQIDRYLGVAPAAEASAPLVITLDGPGVRLGESRGSIVTRTYENLRKGIAAVLDALTRPDENVSVGRRMGWIEDVTDLPFSLATGSVRIVLGEPTTNEVFTEAQLADFRSALGLIVKGVEWADSGGDAPLLPDGTSEQVRHAVLLTLRRLLPTHGSEVETVAFGGRMVTKEGGAQLTKASRGRIQHELRRPATTTEYVELVGTIREVDLDKREFRLRESSGVPVDTQCAFDAWMQTEVTTFLDLGEPVIVAGTLRTTKGRDRRLDVEIITPPDGVAEWEPGAP